MADVTHLRQLEDRAVAAIRSAFPSGAPPTASEMRNDHCPECAETNAVFTGKRWEDIAVADLAGNPAVSLLTAIAFRYYLPALMLRCIEAAVKLDCLPASVVGMLSPPNGKPDARLADLLGGFDQAQVGAVRAFLHVFEAREKMDRYPPEAFDTVPASRVFTRALAFWSDPRGPSR
jgi:hypothetical protein